MKKVFLAVMLMVIFMGASVFGATYASKLRPGEDQQLEDDVKFYFGSDNDFSFYLSATETLSILPEIDDDDDSAVYIGASQDGCDLKAFGAAGPSYIEWDASEGTFTNKGTTMLSGAFEQDIIHVASDDASISLGDADSGQPHIVPDVDADVTFTLPTEADHLHYKLVYVGGAADAHDWIIDSGSNTNYFVGGLVHHDTDNAGDDTATYYSNGSTNSKVTVYTPAAGTVVEIWCDGTNWYITGTVISATDTGVAFEDQS